VTSFFLGAAAVLLASVGAALWRVLRGPAPADRMMAAQLVGTGGVATLLLISAAEEDPAIVDVALVLALLAAFAAIAFVKAARGGTGDPEADEEGDPDGTGTAAREGGRG
jgi:multicomponent Na+:H+ antiporter subunit F